MSLLGETCLQTAVCDLAGKADCPAAVGTGKCGAARIGPPSIAHERCLCPVVQMVTHPAGAEKFHEPAAVACSACRADLVLVPAVVTASRSAAVEILADAEVLVSAAAGGSQFHAIPLAAGEYPAAAVALVCSVHAAPLCLHLAEAGRHLLAAKGSGQTVAPGVGSPACLPESPTSPAAEKYSAAETMAFPSGKWQSMQPPAVLHSGDEPCYGLHAVPGFAQQHCQLPKTLAEELAHALQAQCEPACLCAVLQRHWAAVFGAENDAEPLGPTHCLHAGAERLQQKPVGHCV